VRAFFCQDSDIRIAITITGAGGTHGFEILRTSLDFALPIAPYLSSASALPWWSTLLV